MTVERQVRRTFMLLSDTLCPQKKLDSLFMAISQILQGVPKKMSLLSGFEFLTLGGVFLGVKKILRTLGTKKI